jgi:ATP-dependent DNA helicase RecG
MSELLQQPVKFLSGVGPKRAELLQKELGIETCEDLLYYFPFKYIDRSRFYSIREVDANLPYIQVKAKLTHLGFVGQKPRQRLVGIFSDNTGELECVWFQGVKWVEQSLKTDKEYVVFGKPSAFGSSVNIVHPDVEEIEKFEGGLNASLQAFYNTTEKLKTSFLNSRAIQKLITTLVLQVRGKISETLPAGLVQKINLLPLNEALYNIHFPTNAELLKKAEFRLKFEELFYIQLGLLKQKINRERNTNGFIFTKVGDYLNEFYRQHLPFELTDAQKRVIKEIRKDMGSGKQMNRLLQGDVGSGKTLVSLMCMLIALDNGFQACIMAPTEILANQHFETISRLLENMPVKIGLLTGSTKQAIRKELHAELQNGEMHLLIGTHALIEETVQFKNLGLVVIDEQHRFGVAQRAKLWTKNNRPPHVLVMTATPIPRTLAMTLYGDLDVSVIDELPPGRKPIKTIFAHDNKRKQIYEFIARQITEGRQVYVVYPLIQESEKMDYKNLEEGFEVIRKVFPSPQYESVMLHGRMKSQEKEKAMDTFVSGKAHLLVATTVIEVGVNVPNATVMLIESAERFGLSQLHQLRGRVGRGADQSFCILMTSYKLSVDSRKRMDIMVTTNNGFEIAEADLRMRGPGDIEGTQQSGMPFDLKIANLAHDGQILQYARDIAEQIIENDPLLQNETNALLVKQLNKLNRRQMNWSVIS